MTPAEAPPGRSAHDTVRIGIFGQLGSGNWGNDAGLDVVMELLDQRWPDARIGFMSMGTPAVASRRGAPVAPLQWYEASARRFRFIPSGVLKVWGRLVDVVRTVAWPRGYDVVIVPGAGVLEDTTPVRPWAMPFSLLLLGLGARLSGTTLAYVAVGASVPPPGATRRVMRWAARLAHYRSYRDEISRDAVADLGVNVAADRVFTDLAFALPCREPRTAEETQPATVVVGVMNFRGRSKDRERAVELHTAYVAAVQSFVTGVLARDWHVLLVTGDREDEAVARSLREAAIADQPEADGRLKAAFVASMDQLMDEMARARFAVASRFHNVIGALLLGLPTISLSYAAKNDVLMSRLGLRDLSQPIGAIDPHRLTEQFDRLQVEEEELTALLARTSAAERRIAQEQLTDLTALIESVERRQ